jgi:hypothetical protein
MKVRVCMSAGERARVLVEGKEVDAIVRGEYPVTGDWVEAR